ncbi:hypothetical protein LNQ81_12965 [Myroides sp. M-43]|uniref:plasmid mobilization protein n=1 Tax=Myroides oncorhynchi TaxID=2893756 RepID=UPI001E61767F|nr:hypothetical protein [Myroides oncorhynchi]MCC9043585.1 hypothetical protein [Myroides oncorhynchi]
MKDNTTSKIKTSQKASAIYRVHSVGLTEQEQLEFERILVKYNIRNKSRFIALCILNKKLKAVVIDKVSLDYHAELTTLINHFKAFGVSYNILVNKYDVSKESEEVFKDILKTTLELSRLCKEIISLTLAFENRVLYKADDYGG